MGPVTFYDTAGLDDAGDLGELRVKAARKVLWRADMALVITDELGLTDYEKQIIDEVQMMEIPLLVVFNKIDLAPPRQVDMDFCAQKAIAYASVSAKERTGVTVFRAALISGVPQEMKREPVLLADLITEGDTVLCVVPIDLAAPKGRLILPQVQALREILDCDAIGMVVKEREIEQALSDLKRKPTLVVTDSQVILKVAGDVDNDIPLTTFSILFARFKGDLMPLLSGARSIETLQDGDKVLIAEACSHHIQADDIGRVKIPRWIIQYTGQDIQFDVYSGHDFPENLEQYKLVIHCGACMLNRMEMMRRINECRRRGVQITNYGIAISKVQGVLHRVVAPFFPHSHPGARPN